MYYVEPFTPDEVAVLSRFFTNTDRPVFALVNLPEVVKGALFARYSRSPKSVRRLFLDEFMKQPELGVSAIAERIAADDPIVKIERAEKLYERVFNEYGDDSVAQLGGVHLACEQASNILTKVLEWGRLGAYLEQSTRYMFYDQRLGDRYRYFVPKEVKDSPLTGEYAETMTWMFDAYSSLVKVMVPYFEKRFPRSTGDSNFIWRSTIRAKACDTIRGLLPAATLSNVGIFATAQSYEMMLLRMRAHPLAEARDFSSMILEELRRVIPAFMRRVDVPERGGAWSAYLAETAQRMEEAAAAVDEPIEERPEVTLVEWDDEAETKLVAAALYAYTDLPDDQLLELARRMGDEERRRVFAAYVGDRGNRRHKPGRGLERVYYRFDILSDFGIFRDLQRHRLLTIEWQRLGTRHGYVVPDAVVDTGKEDIWREAMARAGELYDRVHAACGPDVAQYAVPFAYRIRYVMQLNAREALHMLELRTAREGHPDYRRVCQTMHSLIREKAGHRLIADAMKFVDHTHYDLERLEGERRAEKRRRASGVPGPPA